MNFDIKDVKSWSTRNEVELGKIGFFANSIEQLYKEECVISKLSLITKIDAFSFGDENNNSYAFFLPLDAVKKDKSKKKYRPFKSMAEFTKVVYDLVPDYLNITGVGESFMVRRKYNQHIEKVLITHLEYDANHNLISINGQSLKSLFENYEIITDDDKIIPFGVEVKDD